jgi:hypothetical protein
MSSLGGSTLPAIRRQPFCRLGRDTMPISVLRRIDVVAESQPGAWPRGPPTTSRSAIQQQFPNLAGKQRSPRGWDLQLARSRRRAAEFTASRPPLTKGEFLVEISSEHQAHADFYRTTGKYLVAGAIGMIG